MLPSFLQDDSVGVRALHGHSMGCYCCDVRKVAGTRTGTRDGCNGTFHSPLSLVLARCVGFGRCKLTTFGGHRTGWYIRSRELTVRSRLRGYANHSHSFRNAGPSDASSWYGGAIGTSPSAARFPQFSKRVRSAGLGNPLHVHLSSIGYDTVGCECGTRQPRRVKRWTTGAQLSLWKPSAHLATWPGARPSWCLTLLHVHGGRSLSCQP